MPHEKNDTTQAIENHAKDAVEIGSVMNFSKSNLYITYGIITINTIIFLLMVINGVNFFAPRSIDVIKWGANYPALTFGGEWWRLFTSVFLHFGILHLAMNMYALYFIGSYLEPLLGKTRYIAAYLSAGIASSLISVLWHQDSNTASAGASGAIFGMFGVFLSLLTTNVIPKHVKGSILQSVLFFVGFNVFYGFKPNSGIDNAAHLGGLFSGMAIGYAYYFSFKQSSAQRKNLIASLVGLGTVAITFGVMQKKQIPPVVMDYNTGITYPKGEAGNLDNIAEFYRLMGRFDSLQAASHEITNRALLNPGKLSQMQDTVISNWLECARMMETAGSFSLSPQLDTLRKDYLLYANTRVHETKLITKAYEENTDNYANSIDSVQKIIDDAINRINKNIESITNNPDSK